MLHDRVLHQDDLSGCKIVVVCDDVTMTARAITSTLGTAKSVSLVIAGAAAKTVDRTVSTAGTINIAPASRFSWAWKSGRDGTPKISIGGFSWTVMYGL